MKKTNLQYNILDWYSELDVVFFGKTNKAYFEAVNLKFLKTKLSRSAIILLDRTEVF